MRVQSEFADVLDTSARRIGELVTPAEMLQAVARGHYPLLSSLLAARATELTEIQPPTPVSSEIAT
ncbi:hypothetical protein ACIA8O_36840 [Kitasatospora sp. NPDC051853]|uniref:hypothetical protein n=1 Tax=Kitasatospora sp. NPDC051853 TaxID=3364058 RepID=UPI003796862F